MILPCCGHSRHAKSYEDLRTLIFVDVDGVLNVGVRDPGHSPILLSSGNIGRASRLAKYQQVPDMAERIIAVCNRELGHGESGTYSQFQTSSDVSVSTVFVERLAQLIKVAGSRRLVVLSSTWRKKEYAGRVGMLEEALSVNLDEPFCFDATTPPDKEPTGSPEERLRNIGDFIESYCANLDETAGLIRVLVLEDFAITDMGAWSCDGIRMEFVQTAERYLQRRCPSSINLSVRLVHTFDSWISSNGVQVDVGSGLTQEKFCQAMMFLNACCEYCGRHRLPLLSRLRGAARSACRSSKVQSIPSAVPALPLLPSREGKCQMAHGSNSASRRHQSSGR